MHQNSSNLKIPFTPQVSRIAYFYLEREGKTPASDQLLRMRSELVLKGFDSCQPELKSLLGRSIQVQHEGMRLGCMFQLFLDDSLELYESLSSTEAAKPYRQAIYAAFAHYRYRPKDAAARERFGAAFTQFADAISDVSPDSENIRAEFNRWQALLSKNVDIIDVSARESLRQACPVVTSRESVEVIAARMIDLLLHNIDFVQAQIHELLDQVPSEAVALNWTAPATHWVHFVVEQACKRHNACLDYLFADCPFNGKPDEGLQINAMMAPDQLRLCLDSRLAKTRILLEQLRADPCSQQSSLLAHQINEHCKFLQGETGTQTLRHADLAFGRHEFILSTFADPCKGLRKFFASWAGRRVSDEEIRAHPYYDMISVRVEACKLLTTAHELIDSLLYVISSDLRRTCLGQATDSALTTSAIKAPSSWKIPSAEQRKKAQDELLNWSSNKPRRKQSKSRSPKKQRGRKSSAPKSEGTKQASASPQAKIKTQRVAQVSISQKGPSPKPLKQRIRLFTQGMQLEEAHRTLWREFARVLPSLNQYWQHTARRSMLLRLNVTVLHGLLEQGLQQQVAREGNEIAPTHNLWTYRQLMKQRPQDGVITALHKGIHWVRFGREWMREWDRWSTLPTRPEALTRIVACAEDPKAQKAAELEKLVTGWQEEALSIHDSYFKLAKEPTETLEFQAEKFQAKQLDRCINRCNSLAVDSAWMKQWRDDLRDLKATLTLLHSSLTNEQVPLLVSQVLFLLHGSIQSPLYLLQQHRFGEHSERHELDELYSSLNIPLTPAQEKLIKEELAKLSSIYRYPFRSEIRGLAHRLYLNAIAIGGDAAYGRGFQSTGKEELVLSSRAGLPQLKQHLTVEELRQALTKLVEQCMQDLVGVLIDQVKQLHPDATQ